MDPLAYKAFHKFIPINRDRQNLPSVQIPIQAYENKRMVRDELGLDNYFEDYTFLIALHV